MDDVTKWVPDSCRDFYDSDQTIDMLVPHKVRHNSLRVVMRQQNVSGKKRGKLPKDWTASREVLDALKSYETGTTVADFCCDHPEFEHKLGIPQKNIDSLLQKFEKEGFVIVFPSRPSYSTKFHGKVYIHADTYFNSFSLIKEWYEKSFGPIIGSPCEGEVP